MKALVTGATGFIGSHLVDRLIEEGFDVNALIRTTSRTQWLENKPIQMVIGDIRDVHSLRDAVEGQDIIFHVAGAVIEGKYGGFDETNRTGTENIMEAVIAHNPNVSKIIYISSLAAGGPTTPDHPLTEEDPSNPISPYGKTKYAGEQIALSYKDTFNVISVRPPVVYGPRDKGLLTFFQLVAKHMKINLGMNNRYVTMIHVTDLIEAILLVANKETTSGSIYYVDDGTPIRRWLELQEEIAKTLDTWAIRVRIPLTFAFLYAAFMHGRRRLIGKNTWVDLGKYRELSQWAWLCDGTKIRNELGFNPKISIEKGVQETAKWYRQMGWIP